jgi:hypothetical protein
MSEQDTWKAQQQGVAESTHIGHCAHTLEGTDAQVQYVHHVN